MMWRWCSYLGAICWSQLGVCGRTNLKWLSELSVPGSCPCLPPVRRLRDQQAWGSDISPGPPRPSWSTPLGRNLPSSPSSAVWNTKHLAGLASHRIMWVRSEEFPATDCTTIIIDQTLLLLTTVKMLENKIWMKDRDLSIVYWVSEYLSVGICWCSWLSNIIRHHPPPTTISGLYSEYSDTVQSPVSSLLSSSRPSPSLLSSHVSW